LPSSAILFAGEGVETVTPLEAGKPGFLPTLDALDATEERLVCLVQPRQPILQGMAVDSLIVGERRP
jgi:hypothetical protein